MVFYDFTFLSLTGAQSGRNVLHSQGIGARLMRAPAQIAAQGCAYALQVDGKDALRSAELLRYYAGGFQRSFRVYSDGRIEEAVL